MYFTKFIALFAAMAHHGVFAIKVDEDYDDIPEAEVPLTFQEPEESVSESD